MRPYINPVATDKPICGTKLISGDLIKLSNKVGGIVDPSLDGYVRYVK
jgi:hypothetical protein